MRWYEGGIAEAVAFSKSKNAYFVVYIEGSDDNSKSMTEFLDRPEISSQLGDHSEFVAIKVKSDSEAYRQFAQIYLMVPVPSLFFIKSDTGAPEEIIFGDKDNLSDVIKQTLQNLKKKKSNPPSPIKSADTVPSGSNVPSSSTSTPTVPVSASGSSQINPNKDSEPGSSTNNAKEEYKVVCEGDVCKRVKVESDSNANAAVSTSETNPSDVSQSNLTVDEKVERVKELIEQKRKEKLEEEKEKEKQKELERRAHGQGLAELKRWQQEQELKNIQEERRKEKLENAKARARILEQIAQDRAERQKQDSQSTDNVKPSPSAPSAPVPSTSSAENHLVTKIQFKMADGSTHTTQVDPDSTLADLRDYVKKNIQTSGTFSLSTMYPRQYLDEDKNDETMHTLGLHPSCVILLLRGNTSSFGGGGSAPIVRSDGIFGIVSQFFWSILINPIYGVWNWLSVFFRGNQGGSSLGSQAREPSASEGSSRVRRNSSERDSEVKRRRVNPSNRGGTTSIRREGNTYRLKDNDSDDENNTWNGNSTQQM